MNFPKNKYFSTAKSILQSLIYEAVLQLLPQKQNPSGQYLEIKRDDIEVEIPTKKEFGDFSTNVAMKLLKTFNFSSANKLSPIQLADKIKAELSHEIIDSIEVVQPGFINFHVKSQVFNHAFNKYLHDDQKQINLNISKAKCIVEFGQPNTHKDFTVGHLKSAISGLAIVRLKEALGNTVIKANYYGDIGLHTAKSTWGFIKEIEKLGRKYFDDLSLDQKMAFIADCYVKGSNAYRDDENAKEEIKKLNKDIYLDLKTSNVREYHELKRISLEYQTEVWKELGILYDVQYPESEVFPNAVKIVKQFFENQPNEVFEMSEGAIVFRGEKFGLNTWVFLTSEGNPTYSAKDLALAQRKFTDFPDLDESIVTTSNEQSDYFKAVIKVISLVFPEIGKKYFHLPFGWMLKDGKKTSSRLGNAIKGIDILNEARRLSYEKINSIKEYDEVDKHKIAKAVADSGLKFFILSHEFHKDINYNFENMVSSDGFSGPYILYSYARAKSILRDASETDLTELNVENISDYTEEELNLIKLFDNFEDIVYASASTLSPHLITTYVYDLAQKFSQFYNSSPVLKADEKTKIKRLSIIQAYSNIVKKCMYLLGIEVIEKM